MPETSHSHSSFPDPLEFDFTNPVSILIRLDSRLTTIQQLMEQRVSALQKEVDGSVKDAEKEHEKMRDDIYAAHTAIRELNSKWDKFSFFMVGLALAAGGTGGGVVAVINVLSGGAG